MRARLSGWALTLLLVILSTSCVRDSLKQARQYELSGNTNGAIQAYKDAFAHTSERDPVRRSEILMAMGDCLVRSERLQEAYSAFQKAADASPGNALAHLRMGELLLAAGSPERAREQALIALGNSESSTDAMALLGSAWLASDDTSMAKRAYEHALEAEPTRVTVAIALADIYNHENNEAKAEEILQQAAAVQPKNALPWIALGRLKEQEGSQQAAESAYRKAVAVEDTPEANLRLAQFLQRAARVVEAEQVLRKVDSQRADRPVALADFQLLSGHADHALQQYRSAMREETPTPDRKRWFLLSRSNKPQSDRKNDADIAARMIEAEILALPTNRDANRERAIAEVRTHLQEKAGQFDAATLSILQAEAALADDNIPQADWFSKAALGLAPNSPAAHYVAGLVASARNDDETAEAEWQSALDQDTHFSPARLSLAQNALGKGKGAEADEQARLVVRDDPGDLQAILIFARALVMEGKPMAAAIMARRASALSPASPEPLTILGEIALKAGNIPGALLNFEHALAISDDSEEAIRGLLQVYRHGTPSYGAVRNMEKVALQPPRSTALLEIAGRLYADHGWTADAKRSLSEALTLDPARKTAARELAKLQDNTGDFDAATITAERLHVASPQLLSAYRAQEAGKWQPAILDYERALRKGDQTGAAANNLAWLYAEHNLQLDRALSLAESALQKSPNHPAILDTLGFVHLQRREYTEAVKYFENASRLAALSGSSAENRELQQQIREHLSQAYLHTGQTQAASELYQPEPLFAR